MTMKRQLPGQREADTTRIGTRHLITIIREYPPNNAPTLYLTVEEHLSTYVALMMPRVIQFAARHGAVDSVYVILNNFLFNYFDKKTQQFIISTGYGSPTRAIIEYLNTRSDQLYDGRAIKSSIHHAIFQR